MAAQQAKPVNTAKRMGACGKWGEQILSGELGVAQIYLACEKIFRIGAFHGGDRNFIVNVFQ